MYMVVSVVAIVFLFLWQWAALQCGFNFMVLRFASLFLFLCFFVWSLMLWTHLALTLLFRRISSPASAPSEGEMVPVAVMDSEEDLDCCYTIQNPTSWEQLNGRMPSNRSVSSWVVGPRASFLGGSGVRRTKISGSQRVRLCCMKCGSCYCVIVALLISSYVLLRCLGVYWQSYGALEAELDHRWGFLVDDTRDDVSAPVWLGEFGTDSSGSRWWRHITRYTQGHHLDFAYWSFNGEKRTNHDESFGIVRADSVTIRDATKLAMLQRLAT